MKNIERLFRDGKPVRGMKPSRAPRPADQDEDDEVIASVHDADGPVEVVPEDQSEVIDEAQDAVWTTSQREFPVAVIKPYRAGPALALAVAPGQARAERMRQLRTEIMLRHRPGPQGSMALAILSAAASEGRSTLAAELALSFSQLGRSTLLLDADLRNPRQQELFSGEPRDGLAQAIDRNDASYFYGVEGYPMLSVMPASSVPVDNPLELLSDGRFDMLVEHLRGVFDFIIVDTPRFVDFADAQVIATVVGNVLTVHRARVSSFATTRAMMRQVASTRADVLGATLNQF